MNQISNGWNMLHCKMYFDWTCDRLIKYACVCVWLPSRELNYQSFIRQHLFLIAYRRILGTRLTEAHISNINIIIIIISTAKRVPSYIHNASGATRLLHMHNPFTRYLCVMICYNQRLVSSSVNVCM